MHKARMDHVEWMERFERSVAASGSGFDAEKIARCDCCSMGIWLAQKSAGSLGADPLFARLVELHRVFHQKAAGVAHAANGGARGGEDLAPALGAMREASAQVLDAIQDLGE